MILAEVREHERGEAHAVEPVQRRRVRRRLHRARAVAGVEHLAEEPLQVDRLGRRALHAATLAADARLDRAEQPGPAPRGGEDREEQERRRRLAARAGDAGDLELLRRPAEELVGGDRHRGTRVGHDDLRHRSRSSGRSTTSATAPRSTASAARSRARRPAPRARRRRARRGDGARVVGEVANLDRSARPRRPPRARRRGAPDPSSPASGPPVG